MRLTSDLDVYGVYDVPSTAPSATLGNDTSIPVKTSTDSLVVDKIKIDRNNRVTNFYKRDHYLQITADLMTKWLNTKPLMSSTNN